MTATAMTMALLKMKSPAVKTNWRAITMMRLPANMQRMALTAMATRSMPEDINGNGTVEVSDVLLLLSDFGCTSDTGADIDETARLASETSCSCSPRLGGVLAFLSTGWLEPEKLILCYDTSNLSPWLTIYAAVSNAPSPFSSCCLFLSCPGRS